MRVQCKFVVSAGVGNIKALCPLGISAVKSAVALTVLNGVRDYPHSTVVAEFLDGIFYAVRRERHTVKALCDLFVKEIPTADILFFAFAPSVKLAVMPCSFSRIFIQGFHHNPPVHT